MAGEDVQVPLEVEVVPLDVVLAAEPGRRGQEGLIVLAEERVDRDRGARSAEDRAHVERAERQGEEEPLEAGIHDVGAGGRRGLDVVVLGVLRRDADAAPVVEEVVGRQVGEELLVGTRLQGAAAGVAVPDAGPGHADEGGEPILTDVGLGAAPPLVHGGLIAARERRVGGQPAVPARAPRHDVDHAAGAVDALQVRTGAVVDLHALGGLGVPERERPAVIPEGLRCRPHAVREDADPLTPQAADDRQLERRVAAVADHHVGEPAGRESPMSSGRHATRSRRSMTSTHCGTRFRVLRRASSETYVVSGR